MIYFIQEVGLFRNRVKIGLTDNLKSRLTSMRSDSPSRLKILLATPGDIQTETAYHERFAKYRLHGEWFKYGLGLRLFVWMNQFKPFVLDESKQENSIAEDESAQDTIHQKDKIEMVKDQEIGPTEDESKAITAYWDARTNGDFSWRKATQAAFGKGKFGLGYNDKLKNILDKYAGEMTIIEAVKQVELERGKIVWSDVTARLGRTATGPNNARIKAVLGKWGIEHITMPDCENTPHPRTPKSTTEDEQ